MDFIDLNQEDDPAALNLIWAQRAWPRPQPGVSTFCAIEQYSKECATVANA